MPRMLVASSPVEIEAKAEAAGFSQDAHDTAQRMFHDLTDRLGQATVALSVLHEDWPNHRFYFGTKGTEMSALLDGLRSRPDVLDLTHGLPERPAALSGLYIQDTQDPFIGVLVGHENHEGYSYWSELGRATGGGLAAPLRQISPLCSGCQGAGGVRDSVSGPEWCGASARP